MKNLIQWQTLAPLFLLATLSAHGQTTEVKKLVKERVEVSCGQCNFKEGKNGCSMAIRLDNKVYWVRGNPINNYGDAHHQDGFCNAIRTGIVTGKLINDSIDVKSLKLVPNKGSKKS